MTVRFYLRLSRVDWVVYWKASKSRYISLRTEHPEDQQGTQGAFGRAHLQAGTPEQCSTGSLGKRKIYCVNRVIGFHSIPSGFYKVVSKLLSYQFGSFQKTSSDGRIVCGTEHGFRNRREPSSVSHIAIYQLCVQSDWYYWGLFPFCKMGLYIRLSYKLKGILQ